MKMKYSKGQVMHRKKSTATMKAKDYREDGTPCKVTKMSKGYRVDRKYGK